MHIWVRSNLFLGCPNNICRDYLGNVCYTIHMHFIGMKHCRLMCMHICICINNNAHLWQKNENIRIH